MGLKIELTEIRKISSEAKNVKGQLSTYLKTMTELLEEICKNINSSDLISVNKNFVQAIDNVAKKVEKNLPEIINFLDKQVANYEKTNVETKIAIDSLVSSANETLK